MTTCSHCGAAIYLNDDCKEPLSICPLCGGSVEHCLSASGTQTKSHPGNYVCDNSEWAVLIDSPTYFTSKILVKKDKLNELYEALDFNNRKNYKKALELFERFTVDQCPFALTMRGKYAYLGLACPRDVFTAVALLSRAAEKNDAEANTNLAEYYISGTGVSVDYSKANFYAKRAADQGYAPAFFTLGKIYYHGLGVSANADKAAEYFEISARFRQLSFSLVYLCNIFSNRKQTLKAFDYGLRACEALRLALPENQQLYKDTDACVEALYKQLTYSASSYGTFSPYSRSAPVGNVNTNRELSELLHDLAEQGNAVAACYYALLMNCAFDYRLPSSVKTLSHYPDKNLYNEYLRRSAAAGYERARIYLGRS